MNDSLQNKDDDSLQLQRMLEDMTAADGATPGAAADDHETAGLRAAWLAFGQLLESANSAGFNTSKFQPNKIVPSKPVPKRTRYAGAIAAVAAALCLSLGLGWWLVRDGRQVNQIVPQAVQVQPSQPVNEDTTLQVSPAPQPTASASNVANNTDKKKTAVKQSPSSNKQSDWDDTIDTQITSVSQQIDAVRQTWQHRVDDADLVQYHIDDLSAGLKDDAL